jgi:hypothetical protein
MAWLLKGYEGTFEFEDLVLKLEHGRLDWEHAAMRVGDQDWQALDSIVGLRRAVRLGAQSSTHQRPSSTSAPEDGATVCERWLPDLKSRPNLAAVAALGLGLACWTWWQWCSSRRFPDPSEQGTWSLLGLGPLSLVEYLFVSFDLLLVCYVVMRYLNRR